MSSKGSLAFLVIQFENFEKTADLFYEEKNAFVDYCFNTFGNTVHDSSLDELSRKTPGKIRLNRMF